MRRCEWKPALVSLGIVGVAVVAAFVLLVVLAPIDKPPTGPIPSLQH